MPNPDDPHGDLWHAVLTHSTQATLDRTRHVIQRAQDALRRADESLARTQQRLGSSPKIATEPDENRMRADHPHESEDPHQF